MLRKCSYDADHAECRDGCINQGRYCAVDSISDKYSKTFKPRQACSAHAALPRAPRPARSFCLYTPSPLHAFSACAIPAHAAWKKKI
jgi:hypothetical protein